MCISEHRFDLKRLVDSMKNIRALFLPGENRSNYADAGDLLRVISVGLIGWYHIWQQSWLNPNIKLFGAELRLYSTVASGYMFVDLMLMLSGFLLMLGALSSRSQRPRDFYIARAARILPSYWLCMAIMLFAFALPENLYGSAKHLWTDLLSHLSFTHNLFDQSYRFTHLNGALWTLAVEVQFYLIFPLLAKAFQRRPAGVYCAMTALGVIARIAMAVCIEDLTIYLNRLSAMLDVYANGMLAAWIYHRLCRRPQSARSAWLNTALAIAALALILRLIDAQYQQRINGGDLHIGQMVWRFPLSALGGIFLICGSRSIRLLRGLCSNRIVRFLSGISFNFYIWHQFLAVKLKEWRIPPYAGENPNQAGLQPWQWQYTLCCFTAALLAACIVTYLWEKPCARQIKRALSAKGT